MRRFLLISLVPLVVACAGTARPTPAPAAVVEPAGAVTAPKPESQAAARPTVPPDSKSAAQAQPAPGPESPTGNTAPAGAADLGRQFVQSLTAGDTGGPSATLSDGGRRRLEAKLPAYARVLAACAGIALEVEVLQHQAMTNVFGRFASPCGRFGDLIPLLPPDIIDADQADRKIDSCLVALRSVNNGLRVENFACTPA